MRKRHSGRIIAVLLGLALTGWYVKVWTERAEFFERYYLNAYFRTSVVSLGSSYTLLYALDSRLAIPGDDPPFRSRRVKADRKKLKVWLRENIYDGRSLGRFLEYPLIAGLFSLLLLILLGSRIDALGSDPKVLRGPRILSKWKFWLRGLFSSEDSFYLNG